MIRHAGRLIAALVLFGSAAPTFADDRTADAIVKQIEDVPAPKTRAESMSGLAKKADLIAELSKQYPNDARLPALLPTRWLSLALSQKFELASSEVDAALSTAKDDNLKAECYFCRFQIAMMKTNGDFEAGRPSIEEFVKIAPKDPRSPMLLNALAEHEKDETKRTQLEDRILKEFPTSPIVEGIKGTRNRRAKLGKPFELSFTEAVKGTSIAMADLKGKVVVIDFWATWCGPCVAELPRMKSLYAEYKDRGVEFIGISLDAPKEEGGLDKLKAFVASKEVPWPQYYQGNGWQSAFSMSWGINSIPALFLVDQDGNLVSTEARQSLEAKIKELLAKKRGASSGAGGQ